MKQVRGLPMLVLALALLPAGLMAQDSGISMGTMAPGASVETLDGKPMDLKTFYPGRPVVLEFWATWCPLCRKLEPAMQAARTKYADRVTFVSVGVSANQTPERQKAHAAEHGMTGEFVFDRTGAATRAFSVPHTSYVVVLDATGKVVYTGVGADQDIDAAVMKGLAGSMPAPMSSPTPAPMPATKP